MFDRSLCCVSCVCWCLFWSWRTFVCQVISCSKFLLVDRFPSEPLLPTVIYIIENQLRKSSTESWTRVFRFEVQVANHYTIEPIQILRMLTLVELPLLVGFFSVCDDYRLLVIRNFRCFFFIEWFPPEPDVSNLIYNNDQKVLKKMFYQDLVSGFWVQSWSC